MKEYVVLVDEQDRELGTEEKLRAHLAPVLHRAVSVLVFDEAGRLLMQQRAGEKYHSPLLWSNTCCGHPRPGEQSVDAAMRRLDEEMGVVCDLEPAGTLLYRLTLDDGLFEHELNRVFVGQFNGVPQPNPDEVARWQWVDSAELVRPRSASRELTPWFDLVVDGIDRSAEALQRLPAGVRRA